MNTEGLTANTISIIEQKAISSKKGYSGPGTCGNGVPTPFPRFPLKRVWSCFKMAIFGVHSHTFFVSTTSLVLTCRTMDPGHQFYSTLTCPPSVNARRLKSGHPFVPATQQLISSSDNIKSAVLWADHRWNAELLDNTARLRTFISDTRTAFLEWPSENILSWA